jgi:hypothetical protein
MQSRFKINFNLSAQSAPERTNNSASYSGYVSVPPVVRSATPAPAHMSFMSSMINRVHTTKPGCSACGKKVM